MLKTITLQAKQWSMPLTSVGHHINVVLAAGTIKCLLRQGDDSFQTDLVSGMAFRTDEQYSQVQFYSETAQVIKVWVGQLPLNYSPLEAKFVGASSLKSSSGIIGYGSPSILAPATAGRGKVTISAKENIYVGGIGVTPKTAVLVPANTPFTLSTQGAVYGYTDNPDNVTTTVVTANNVDAFEYQDKKLNPDFAVIFYSQAVDKYYTISGAGIQERSIVDYSVVKTTPVMSTGSPTETINTACPSYVEFDNKFYFLRSKGDLTDLITFDPVKQVVSEVRLMNVGGDIIDYKLDGARNKLVMLINVLGTVKCYVGDLLSLTEKAIPVLSQYGTRAILALDDKLILYGYDHYAISNNNGDSWEPKQPLSFNVSSWGGIYLDKTTGYIFGSAQYQLYRSQDGISWQHIFSFAGNKYQWYVGGGQIYAIGEQKMLFSNNSGEKVEELNLSTWYTGNNNNTRDIFPCSNGALFIYNPSEGLLRFGGDVVTSGGTEVALLEEVN